MRALKIIVLTMSKLNNFAVASYSEGISQHYKFTQRFLEAAICLLSKKSVMASRLIIYG